MREQSVKNLTMAGIIAALYLLLTLPFLQISFGLIQFRLAEALAVLPILTVAAVPGLFLGCLLANILNPQNLGLIDIVFGSLATLLAAYLTYYCGRYWREFDKKRIEQEEIGSLISWRLVLPLLPPIFVNALTVGIYLPFLLFDQVKFTLILISISSLLISQSVVIILFGLPLLFALHRTSLFK